MSTKVIGVRKWDRYKAQWTTEGLIRQPTQPKATKLTKTYACSASPEKQPSSEVITVYVSDDIRVHKRR